MKEPKVKIHFCDECYSKILDGEINVRSAGNIETLRKRIEELIKEKNKVVSEFESYKNHIKTLLK